MSEKSNPNKETEKKTSPNKNKTRKPKKKNKKRSPLGSIIHGITATFGNIFLLIVLVGMIGVYFACDIILGYVYEVPEVDPTTIEESLTENSIIVDSNGQLLETLYDDDGARSIIEYNEIGQNMIDAITAIEDKTFFEHKGFNYIRLAGAAIEGARTGDFRGTSSITQQLAKNMYLSGIGSMERKIKEAYYAILLERTLSKEQIIEAYLNKIGLGMNNNGVQAAARFYFSKDAKDLTLVESAIIAGIPKDPNTYAPVKRLYKDQVTEEHVIFDDSDQTFTLVFNPVAQERFNDVVYQMYTNDMITEEEYQIKDEDISKYINITAEKTNYISSYFGDMIKDDVIDALANHYDISKEDAQFQLYNRGYVIEATIDYDMQKQLEDIYNSIDFSNKFDNATYNAVKTFQAHNSLSQDGIAGPNTLANIIEQTSASAEDFSQDVYKLGYTSEDVVTLKKALDELGLMSNDGLFPRAAVRFDENNNILYDDSSRVLLYHYDNLVNDDKELVIKNEFYYYDSNDNMVILKNHGLEFYQQPDRVQVVVSKVFRYNELSVGTDWIDGVKYNNISDFYIYLGKDVMIPDGYKSKVDGNLVIDKSFFKDHPDFFEFDDNGDILISEDKYFINARGEIQPQSAFVILDNATGQIKAVVGGRESYGKNIFNRALSPQQPGSSIKPIGPYSVAIDSKQFTAATVLDDVPSFLNDKAPETRWPYNWYESNQFKYRGRMNLRAGIEYSVNVLAVKLSQAVGVENVINHLQNLGITSIVTEGPTNDMNLSAVSLGGMTKGISPLELAAAYATYANQGIYTKPISFTKVTDLSGNVIIENVPEQKRAVDEQVAYIVQDMMISAVTTGVSSSANFDGMTMAGKTGTTSDKRDAVFVGYTPYYTGAVWFGNDVRVKMDDGSGAAARFWSVVMEKLHEGKEDIGFVEPEGLQRVSVDRVSGKRPGELSALDPAGSQVYRELFIPGTAPTEIDDSHVEVVICPDNEKHVLASEYCPNPTTVVLRTRLDEYDPNEVLDKHGNPILTQDYLYTVPHEVCDIHDAATVVNDGKAEKVIQTFPSGILFIRDYNLLLENGEFIFIPEGTEVLIDQTIVLPSGQQIKPDEYNVLYITDPAKQIEEIFRRTQEEQGQSEEGTDTNTDTNND
ncbi:transglycosylase domain-containing protein [Acidaminobacter sp. JC074]|uniref:transglycosylase domain-containing protein n=1 Tax=Acidaminobacter sp. JC074 TaxID=2530199 RepID=UPI001F100166|nr:transglycosylase domain-containing protein [Acidaminobacter sp. JC074]